MLSTAKARGKIALLWQVAKLNNAVETDLERRLKQGTQTDASGRSTPVQVEELPFGSVIRTGPNDKVEMPAGNVGAADTVEVLQAGLRSAAALVQMPEWMFTNLVDAKYSNAFVSESPALKAFKRLQRQLITRFGEGRLRQRASVVWRAIRLGVAAGLLPAEALTAVRVTCTAPALEVRDKQAEARTNQVYVGLGVKSIVTTQEEIGLDPETEKKRGATPFTKITGFQSDGTPITAPNAASSSLASLPTSYLCASQRAAVRKPAECR